MRFRTGVCVSRLSFQAKLLFPGIALLWLLCGNGMAQSTAPATAAIVSAGYSAPAQFIQAAPGQMLSVMVYGLEHRLQNRVVATGTPLPTALAGFSMSVQQGQDKFPVPLLGVQQSSCGLLAPDPGLCPTLTILSGQIPFEVFPDCLLCGRPTILSYLIISDNGVNKTSVQLVPRINIIHVIDPCDTTALLSVPPNEGARCGKFVTHADGSRVDVANPARVGEQLVMYAFGLGRTDPLVSSGQPTPSPPPQFPPSVFGLHFDPTANAKPSLPDLSFREDRPSMPTPVYAGLVPGFVGLYQVNFVVPAAPTTNPYVPCSGSVLSNLTVTLFGPYPFEFDGAGICVVPQ